MDINGEDLFCYLFGKGVVLLLFIFVIGYGKIDIVVCLFKFGVSDYLIKLVDILVLFDILDCFCW